MEYTCCHARVGLGLSDKRADLRSRRAQRSNVPTSTLNDRLASLTEQIDAMASYLSATEALTQEQQSSNAASPALQGRWADKYRGATVEDLDPPPALSVSPKDPISSALLTAYERDYTHLTVISSSRRSLIGYLSIPHLKKLLQEGAVQEADTVSTAMQRFNRKRGTYQVITMETPLEDLEAFFESEVGAQGEKRGKQGFAVVTDVSRKFVLGVATRADLEEFVKRRPA